MYANQLLSSPAVLQLGPGQSSAVPPEPVQQNALQQLVSTTDIDVLENGVNAAYDFLHRLKEPLRNYSPTDGNDAADWIKSIDELLSRPRQRRTIVGVVGHTGAGKSSVINAVLDEERLLPTNGMRACTASATEVSYNDSDDPAALYRAEIEFISADEWLKELKGLYGDLLNGDGKVTKDCYNADSDAGRAYAKIKAVYPKISKEQIERSKPAELVKDYEVKHVVGTLLRFEAADAETMYERLQSYVVSRERVPKAQRTMEHWPLIKVVRIFTKSSALSTGAVIVDLPGGQDSNAARVAVAANYMKECTGLWIVAPITRAVDDKTAKKLLGDSFKRQLMYDGTYSAVTFICSKTDDISITEVADSLRLNHVFAEDWKKMDELNSALQDHAKRTQELQDQDSALAKALKQLETQQEQWEELEWELGNRELVYAPSPGSGKKRKRTVQPPPVRLTRSQKLLSSTDLEGDIANDTDWDARFLSDSDSENRVQDTSRGRVPLSEDQINEKKLELWNQVSAIRSSRSDIQRQGGQLSTEMNVLTLEKGKLDSIIKNICIQNRNQYSRREIRSDFAQGIKELDQASAMQMDEASFDPEEDLRDYVQVAESLPVFCVSSRAFQQMRGRLTKDNFNHGGYTRLEDTEVPQLQQHAKQLTEAGRLMISRRNDLATLVGSMQMWASDDGTLGFTKEEKFVQQGKLQNYLAQLDKDFITSLDGCMGDIETVLERQIIESLGKYLPLARDAAFSLPKAGTHSTGPPTKLPSGVVVHTRATSTPNSGGPWTRN